MIYLETQKPIRFNGLDIYQFSLNDILDYDMDRYNMMLLPYLLDVDDFDINDKSLLDNINIFDILVYSEDFFKLLLDSVRFFCKTNQISFDEQKGVLYINDGYLDRNNFSEFSEIILKINAKNKPEKEIPPRDMTEKQLDIWNKLQKGRKRKLEKSQIDLSELINICQFGGDYYIPIEDILKMNMWNIARCYKSIVGKSSFNESFDIYCVTGEEKLIKNRHWTDLIRVDDNKKEEII